MKEANLIVVGKLKDAAIEKLEADYLKRISNPKLKIFEVKAKAENKDLEAKEVLKKINEISKGKSYQLILLAEHGKLFNSVEFSQYVTDKSEQAQSLIFVIAGAEGHGEDIINAPHEKLSLSKLTYPHKIARLLFCEQFYRAQTIREGHPYHN